MLTISVGVIIVIITLLFILGAKSHKSIPPGLVGGMLSKCSQKPNCVSSEIKSDDPHFISPLTSSNNIVLLNGIIQEMGGVLVNEKDNYFAYQFTSKVFGFVDDFEVRLEQSKNLIHFRSASRVGTSDLGVNRNRVERVKKLYQDRLKSKLIK